MQLAPMAIGLGGSMLGSKLGGGPPAESRGMMNILQQGAKTGYNFGSSLMNMAGQAFNPVVDYWSRMLSGNKAAAMSALAPEIARMGDQNTAEMKAASTLMPRGGARASLMSTMPFQNLQRVQSLFQGLRPQAATSLGTVGGSLASQGTNALNASTNAGRSVMDFQLEQARQQAEQGANLGDFLYSGTKGVDFSKLFKKKPPTDGGGAPWGNIMGPGGVFTQG